MTVLDSVKVRFGAGFGVLQVTTSFESRQILLSDVPLAIVPAEITAALRTFGEVIAVLPAEHVKSDAGSAYRVTFALADSAIEAAEALNGSQHFGTKVAARVVVRKSTGIGGGTFSDTDVLFDVPTPRAVYYVGYKTEEEAQKAMAVATKRELRGMKIKAVRYEGIPMVGMVNVRYEYMPPNTTLKDIARFGDYEDHMLKRPKYLSIRAAIDPDPHGQSYIFAIALVPLRAVRDRFPGRRARKPARPHGPRSLQPVAVRAA